MLIYIVLLLFMLWILLIRNSAFYKSDILRNLILYITLIVLFILYVFRDKTVGSDYLMYNSLFNVPKEILKLDKIESAYITINSIAQNYSNFLLVPIIIFLIFLIGMIFLSKTFNMNRFTFLAFFVISYLYLSSFNVMRQYSAIGIIGIAITFYFYFYYHRIFKYFLFILITLFASLFHSTAIFCILFVIFNKIYITEKKVVMTGILTSILFFTNIIRNLSSQLLSYFPEYGAKYSMIISSNGKGIIQFLPVVIQFYFLYIYVKYNKTTNPKIRFILSGYFFFLFLYSGGGNLVLDRLQMYSYIFPLLFSGLFLDNNGMIYHYSGLTRYYKYLFVLFWITYFILRLIVNNAGIVPYNFL